MANLANAANNASKAASTASKTVNTAANTATKATQTAGTVTKTASMPTKSVGTEVATNASQKPTLKELKQEVNNINSIGKEDYNIDENKEYKPGDRVAPGKVVNKDGEIEDSATKKTGEAALKVASIFAGGGAGSAASSAGGAAAKETVKQTGKQAAAQGAKNVAGAAAKGAKTATKAASNASKNGLMDAAGNLINSNDISRDVMNKATNVIGKATGDVADALDKVGMDKALKATGVEDAADSVNSVFDAFGNLLNGDLSQMFDNLGKTIKSGGKFTAKSLFLLIVISLVSTVFTIIMMFLPIWIVMIPALHAVDFITDKVSKVEEFFSDNAYISMYGAGLYMNEAVKAVTDEVPGFDTLSNGRKVVVVAGATAIGTNYKDGGKPTDATATGITGGIDSNGLIEWVFWNVTGSDPGTIDVANLGSNSNFTGISEGDLKPGDIGVNGSDAGIYLGNGYWVYIDKNAGVMRGQYSGFTSFYTYNNIDTIAVAAGGGGGGNGIIGPAPSPEASASLREKVLFYGEYIISLGLPYASTADGYYAGNVTNIDPTKNEFLKAMYDPTSYLGNPVVDSASLIHGIDCCRFTGYAYALALGKTSMGVIEDNHCYHSHWDGSDPNWQKISVDDVLPGDVCAYKNRKHWVLVYSMNPDKKTMTVLESSGGHNTTKKWYNYNPSTGYFTPTTKDNLDPNGNWVGVVKNGPVKSSGRETSICDFYRYVGSGVQ
ncbi:MAG: C40 family peptidase [Bacilli bacterium]|nr:C40 family peptidase [Bacilli bacterium]